MPRIVRSQRSQIVGHQRWLMFGRGEVRTRGLAAQDQKGIDAEVKPEFGELVRAVGRSVQPCSRLTWIIVRCSQLECS